MEQLKKTFSGNQQEERKKNTEQLERIPRKKEMDHLEIPAQMPDHPRKKSVNMLRRIFSENTLDKKLQSEKGLLLDSLSKITEQRILQEKWHSFLKDKKEDLEIREVSLEVQIILYLDKYSKQRALRLFQQELDKLLLKSEEGLKRKSQEHIEPERLDPLATQAVERLLKGAKSRLEKRRQELGSLTSVAMEQIANKVQNLLDPQEIDQRVQKPANQPEKRDLKQVVENKLKQFLENFQQSLEIRVLPLLDSAKLKKNMTEYSKELEEDLKAIHLQMEEIEKKLQANKEQLNKMSEEEKEISGDLSLRGPAPDGNVSNFERIPDESTTSNEGLVYDPILRLKYEKQKTFEGLTKAIKNKYSKENSGIYPIDKEYIRRIISDMEREREYKQAKDKANEAYKRAKRADSERWDANHCHKLARAEYAQAGKDFHEAYRDGREENEQKRKEAHDKKEMAFRKQAETSRKLNDARKKQALADEELEAAERELRGQYKLLLEAVKEKQNQIQSVVKGLEEEQDHSELYLAYLTAYEKAVRELEDKYNKYDEAAEKIKKAEVLSDKIEGVIDEYKQLHHAQKTSQEQLQLAKESLAKIKNDQRELANLKKRIKVISYFMIQTSRELSKAQFQEKDAKEFNSLLKKPAKTGVELYRKLDGLEIHLLKMEEELKVKKKECSQLRIDLRSMENKITEIENNLEKKEVEQRNYGMDLQGIIRQYESLERKRTAIRENKLNQLEDESDERIKEIVSLRESMREIESTLEDSNSTIKRYIDEINEITKRMTIINGMDEITTKYNKSLKDYQRDIQSDKEQFTGDLKQIYDRIVSEIKDISNIINKRRIKYNNGYKFIEKLNDEIKQHEKYIKNLNQEKLKLDPNIALGISSIAASIVLSVGYTLVKDLFQSSNQEKIASKSFLTKLFIGKIYAVSLLCTIIYFNKYKNTKNEIENIDINISNKRKELSRLKLEWNQSNHAKNLVELVSQYDKAIIEGLRFKKVAEMLCESNNKEYSEKKTSLLEEMANEIDSQKANENALQSNLNKIKDAIIIKEKKLSEKQEDRQSLQEKFATIDRQTKRIAEEIEIKSKEKQKLSDEIKNLKLLETKAMRLKENIADLALEKIAQLYDLALQDPKVPRVSPTATGRRAQETVTPSSPLENQEAQGVPGRQAASLAIREQEDDFQRSTEVSIPQNKGTHRRLRRFKPKPAAASESSSRKQATGGFSESDSDDELSRQLDKLNLGSSVPNEKSQ